MVNNELFNALFTDKEKVAEFSKELSYIKTDIIREMAEKCIINFPNYFWIKPASSSGKYHPLSDLGVGGLERHTKNDICMLQTLLTHPHLSDKYSTVEKDCAILALLVHDSVKFGLEGGEHTVYEHPALVREYYNMEEFFEEDSKREQAKNLWNVLVCPLVESHMGCWNKNREQEEILSVPSTDLEWLVHFADFIASKRYIDIQPHTSYDYMAEKVESKPTVSQLNYISSLESKIKLKNPNWIPKNPKTLSEASNYIKELKGLI